MDLVLKLLWFFLLFPLGLKNYVQATKNEQDKDEDMKQEEKSSGGESIAIVEIDSVYVDSNSPTFQEVDEDESIAIVDIESTGRYYNLYNNPANAESPCQINEFLCVVPMPSRLGDRNCDEGIYNTPECCYDNGEFNKSSTKYKSTYYEATYYNKSYKYDINK